jgi:hypothetical protein
MMKTQALIMGIGAAMAMPGSSAMAASPVEAFAALRDCLTAPKQTCNAEQIAAHCQAASKIAGTEAKCGKR